MMSDDATFIHLRSRTMHPCFETKQAHEEAMRSILCPSCLHPRSDVMGVDVWLQERVPRDKPLNFIYASGIGLIHKELLDLLGDEHVRRDLYLGKVTGDGGRRIADWVTFRARRGVIVRGSKDTGYRTCTECGRNLYYAGGKRYLYPAPPADATIFGSHLFGLVVPPDVYERVSSKKWRRLGIDKLPVLDQPLDGFGEIPFFDGQSL